MIAPDVILHAKDVESGYGDAQILHGVNIAVGSGTIVTVMGPNGSGKSTFLKTVIGLVRHTAGRTTIRARDGRVVDITNIRPYALGSLGVSYVSQVSNVFADMSVLENLKLGGLPLEGGPAAVRRRIDSVLEHFPVVRERLSARAGTLSGGQRQMLALARALVPNPTLLLLDEPSAGLQPDVVDSVFAKIREFGALGVSILIVEQKARQSLAFSDYAYVLDMGRNRYEGRGAQLVADPAVIDLYLGAGRLNVTSESEAENSEDERTKGA